MNNPRRNHTTAEVTALQLGDAFTLPLDLVDSAGNRSRFWFAEDSDRRAFALLWETLHSDYGHTTRAIIPGDGDVWDPVYRAAMTDPRRT